MQQTEARQVTQTETVVDTSATKTEKQVAPVTNEPANEAKEKRDEGVQEETDTT